MTSTSRCIREVRGVADAGSVTDAMWCSFATGQARTRCPSMVQCDRGHDQPKIGGCTRPLANPPIWGYGTGRVPRQPGARLAGGRMDWIRTLDVWPDLLTRATLDGVYTFVSEASSELLGF